MADETAAERGTTTVFQRERAELEFARIVAFSDGVFAIAITLTLVGSTASLPGR
jgi:hypothetical protein